MHKNLPLILIVCGMALIAGSIILGASNAVTIVDGSTGQTAGQSSRSAMLNLIFYIGVIDVVAGICLYWVRAGLKRSGR